MKTRGTCAVNPAINPTANLSMVAGLIHRSWLSFLCGFYAVEGQIRAGQALSSLIMPRSISSDLNKTSMDWAAGGGQLVGQRVEIASWEEAVPGVGCPACGRGSSSAVRAVTLATGYGQESPRCSLHRPFLLRRVSDHCPGHGVFCWNNLGSWRCGEVVAA